MLVLSNLLWIKALLRLQLIESDAGGAVKMCSDLSPGDHHSFNLVDAMAKRALSLSRGAI